MTVVSLRSAVRATAGVAVLVLGAAALTGCVGPLGTSRSVEAFCRVMEEHQDRYVAAMAAVTERKDPSNLEDEVTYLGEMWQAVAKVAPDEVRDDVENVLDEVEAAEQMFDDQVPQIGLSLIDNAAHVTGRVGAYTTENCPNVGAMFGSGSESNPEADATGGDEGADSAPTEPILSYELETEDGYSYVMRLEDAEIEAEIDVANAAPGEAKIKWNISYSASVENTTPERNAPFPRQFIWLDLLPIWSMSSPFCASTGGDESVLREVGEEDRNIDIDELQEKPGVGSWCSQAVNNRSIFQIDPDDSDAVIPVGSSETEQATLSLEEEYLNPVPEAEAEEVLESLLDPDGWVILKNAGEEPLVTNCAMRVAGGLSPRNGYLIASSIDTGCEVVE